MKDVSKQIDIIFDKVATKVGNELTINFYNKVGDQIWGGIAEKMNNQIWNISGRLILLLRSKMK